MRQVPYVNFPAQFAEEKDELLAITERVFARGEFVGGAVIEALEAELAVATGTRFAVALNSGTDALILGMKALGIGPGDEVITPPNSFVASTAAIVALGATPVFADVRDDQNIDPAAMEAAITPRTKAVMPVHLTGRMADMAPIMDIARRHGLAVVEDAAQSIGSRYDGTLSGGFGHIGCFSAHPLKNLNAAGDAGFLVTNDEQVASRVRLLRNHGLIDRNTVVEFGTVSRLDVLQAEYLRFRLTRLDRVIEARRANAALYRAALAGLPVVNPPCRDVEFNTFHVFMIQAERRDALQKFLAEKGVGTGIHYPVPIHLQPAAASLGYKPGSMPVTEAQAGRILSLPINQYITAEDIDYVCAGIREFYG
ncbi:transcriptional regulator [Magnetospirillum sp. ME-1]|uniref:DegT/DnrJ/EryC1/StrS family aminotransferase n=1 Tax=Magnetospirillum sp. ME-1 TaxID=1639348 RepID=UPI000A17C362|nr:DegT/DnrJ/EryC1/StrS family aminotransferase [Magnetospirillum sp. ME-1]ARJ66515.1 transcriptional regulator [Magnetospirillum sp. ME-1]